MHLVPPDFMLSNQTKETAAFLHLDQPESERERKYFHRLWYFLASDSGGQPRSFFHSLEPNGKKGTRVTIFHSANAVTGRQVCKRHRLAAFSSIPNSAYLKMFRQNTVYPHNKYLSR
jgi:hypothetical protein